VLLPSKGGPENVPAPYEASPAPQLVNSLGRFRSGTFLAGLEEDEEDPSATMLGPGDSHYELSPIVDGEDEDSHAQVGAHEPHSWSSEKRGSALTEEDAGTDGLPTSPRYFRFIESWGRYYFGLASGFGALALVALIFFLVRMILVGPYVSSAVAALIVGCVGLIAFLLLAVTGAAGYLLMVDLARNVRRLRDHSERIARVAGD